MTAAIGTRCRAAGRRRPVELMKVGATRLAGRLHRARGAAHRAGRGTGGARLGALARGGHALRAGPRQALLEYAWRPGAIPAQPIEPLAHVLIGALDEAALYVARSDGSAQTRQEVDDVIDRIVDAVLAG